MVMGLLMESIIITGSFDFPDVPPQIARQTFRDITSAPEFVPHLLSVNFLRGEPSTVGACWDERRTFRGGEVVVRKTITRIVEDPHYTVNAGVETVETNRWTPFGSQTFTFVIEPIYACKSNSCTIRWTIACLPSDVRSKMITCCCRTSFEAAFSTHVEDEMAYFYVEALRRTVNAGKMKEAGAASKQAESASH